MNQSKTRQWARKPQRRLRFVSFKTTGFLVAAFAVAAMLSGTDRTGDRVRADATTPPAAGTTAGPVILGGDDLTDHGSAEAVIGPASGVTVDESEPNDQVDSADVMSIGDDYAGTLADVMLGPATGATVTETEPNNSPADTADSMNIGDDYTGQHFLGDLGPFSGVVVNESEPNDLPLEADPVSLGDDFTGEIAIPPMSPASGVTVDETEPNDGATDADVISIGDDYAGELTETNDEDFVAFDVPAGTRIGVVALPAEGSSLPISPIYELFDTDGVTALTGSVDAGGFEFFTSTGGRFFVRVKAVGSVIGTYTLVLRRLLGTADFDMLRFTVGSPTIARILPMGAVTQGMFLNLRGPTVGRGTGLANNRAVLVALPVAGQYTIELRHFGPFIGGLYRLELRDYPTSDVVDTVAVTVTEPTDIHVARPPASSFVDLRAFDVDGISALPSSFTGGGQLFSLPAGGTYFLSVRAAIITLEGLPPPSIDTPYTLELRTFVNGRDPTDFTSFIVENPAGRNVNLRLVAETIPHVSLFLLNDQFAFFGHTTSEAAEGLTVFLPADTYIIQTLRLGSDAGDYRIELRDAAQGAPRDGWLYLQRALENVAPRVRRPDSDGSVAALGSSPSGALCCDAGAAIGVAAAAAGMSVTYYDGEAAINQFFADLAAGTVNPAILWLAGTDAENDLETAEGAALTAHSATIASFVNSGGGLIAHGGENVAVSYGWLGALFPSLTAVDSGGDGDLLLTLAGETAFPGITEADINAGPWHNHFEGDLGALQVLADSGDVTVGGRRAPVIIGGAQVVLPENPILTPFLDFAPDDTDHTVTAFLHEQDDPLVPVPGIVVTFEVVAGPNAAVAGICDPADCITPADGLVSFTYTHTGGVGVDEVRASFFDPGAGVTRLSNPALKVWDDDCDANALPDTCDDSCAGFADVCLNFLPCGGGVCNDGNDCTDDFCENVAESFICMSLPTAAGTPCGDPSDSQCDHPDVCDGTGVCLSNEEPGGTACDDGLVCTVEDQCELPGTMGGCVGTDVNVFSCTEDADCVFGTASFPCIGGFCNCCSADATCDDGQFCNGVESCVNGLCVAGVDPCPGLLCNEATDTCEMPTTLFVDDSATGSADGLSWENAFPNLQDAIVPPPENGAGVGTAVGFVPVEVRVAQGVYKPDIGLTQTAGDRTSTFRLRSGVTILGGFAGRTDEGECADLSPCSVSADDCADESVCEMKDPNRRDVERFETILSGDLGGDDPTSSCCRAAPAVCVGGTQDGRPCDPRSATSEPDACLLGGGTCEGTAGCDDADCEDRVCSADPFCCSVHWGPDCAAEAVSACALLCGGGTGENAYHVVTGSGTDATAALDGFTVTGGNANNPMFPHDAGGGMRTEGGSPIVSNCIFDDNHAIFGGGMENFVDGNPVLTHVTFRNNTAIQAGGVHNNASAPSLNVCRFENNSADWGGAMRNVFKSHVTVTGCTFHENTSLFNAGAIVIDGGIAFFTDCTFTRNHAGQDGGALWMVGGSHTMLSRCAFIENSAESNSGAIRIQDSMAEWTQCDFMDNEAGTWGGALHLLAAGGFLTDCTFKGNIAHGGNGGAIDNNNGSPTLTRCTFTHNTSIGFSGGAMLNINGADPQMVNCVFLGNSAHDGHGGAMFNWKGSSPTIVNCLFSGNSSHGGGGIGNGNDSNPIITNATFRGNRSLTAGGGMSNSRDSHPTVASSIFWGNTSDDGTTTGEPGQINSDEKSGVTIDYSIVEGLTGALGGVGNLGADPMFVDADGPDGLPGTLDDDLRPLPGSPAIDAGDTSVLPEDFGDLDGDRDLLERVPLDLAGKPRAVDDAATVDTGVPGSPVVDIGAFEFIADCNGNGVEDSCDLDCGSPGSRCFEIVDCGTSLDCNGNGILDECEEDCNGNGIPDSCDIADCGGDPACADCNVNGIPDGCEDDCDDDGVPDDCELDACAGDPACGDCNGNGIPDGCDVVSCVDDPDCGDCSGNGILNVCEIARCMTGDAACDDCNLNGIPDGCDIGAGTSRDDDADGIPDECVAPTATGNWSDGTNWDLGGVDFPDNNPANPLGVPGLAVTLQSIDDGLSLLLDVTVSIDALRVLDGGTLSVTQIGAGDLTIATPGGLLDEGGLLVANDRRIDVPLGPVAIRDSGVYMADPDATTSVTATLLATNLTLGPTAPPGGGSCEIDQLTLTDEMSVVLSGDFIMDSTNAFVCLLPGGDTGVVAGGRTPPALRVKSSGFLAAAGNFSTGKKVQVCVGCRRAPVVPPSASALHSGYALAGESAAVFVGGDFRNRSILPSRFDWVNGKLTLDGTGVQVFEVAGIDLGPTFAGFDTDVVAVESPDPRRHTNFAMGTLEVAAGRHVRFVNTHVNTVGTGPCDEALYVHDLILREGSTVVLDRARLYYVNLIEEPGVTKTFIPCGALVPICASVRPDPPSTTVIAKNRYLSFNPGPGELEKAVRVRFVDLPGAFSVLNGQSMWVSQPEAISEIADQNGDSAPTFQAATLQCEPYFADWSRLGTVHVSHANIIPAGVYEVQMLDARCPATDDRFFSDPAEIGTSAWGDVAGRFRADTGRWSGPDGRVDMTADVIAIADKFGNLSGAPIKARADLHPQTPDQIINVLDLMRAVDAFRGIEFPFEMSLEPCLHD